jgi:putative ABC transport system permease protein
MKSGTIRSTLVVFQFVISIFLTVGAVSVNRQFQFIQNKKLGFEKDQVIIIKDAYALRPNNVNPFKEEALKLSSIEAGTISGFVPVENDWVWRSNNSFWLEGSDPSPDNLISSQEWAVDYDYIKTFQMKMKMGRAFSESFPSDQNAIILNETAAKRLGISTDPIGKKVNLFNGPADPENIRSYEVIGIIDDFHFTSLKENISALGLRLGKSDGSISFRFKPNQAKETIQSLEKIWNTLAPGQPFQYSFLDEEFTRMYNYEERLGTIFTLFAGLAIFIACLGLFALTAFTTEQRTKEIGIRKVMGASMQSIVLLLSKEFGKLVLIAFAFATPIAWYAIDWWLKGYSYKIEISWILFAIAGVMVFVIALGTMSFQSIKAANANPIDSLRNE